jgi:soluble lytic murein transglycosylase-like protein
MSDTPSAANPSIAPTSNMDMSDTTSDSSQPTTGADAVSESQDSLSQNSSTPTPQPGSTPTPPQGTPAQGQPGQPGDDQGQPKSANLDRPTFGPNGAAGGNPGQTPPPKTFADHIYDTALTLAGGPRYKESVDVNTGQMTRTPVPVSKSSIGMAIAMEAISGALAGFSQTGPGATGKAAAAGAQAVMQQRQQTDQAQNQNANADFARHAQVLETNLRMHQNAQTLGRMDLETNQKNVDQYAPLADMLQKDHPEVIKGIVDEADLSKYHVTMDTAIPYRVAKRMDPATGQQAVDKFGAPQWNTQYMVVDPNFKDDGFLSDDDKAEAAKYHLPGFVDSDGKATKLPQSLPMRMSMALGYKAKINSLRLAEQDQNAFYDSVNKSASNGNVPMTVPAMKNSQIQNLVDNAANQYGVPVALARAVAMQESGGNPTAVSPKGAQGVMQLMPDTARGLGVTDPMDPQQNVNAGVKYLGQLLKQYDGNTKLALAAYNAGPQNVHGAIPNFPETKNYVASISQAVGLDQPQPKGEEPYKAPDLVKAIQDDPTLVNALEQFQPLLNASGQNYQKAIGALGVKDSQAAGKILSLYGGNSLVYHHDQQMALDADAAKKKVEDDALLSRQSQERVNKNQENAASYEADAKAIAGDPNDPGSGDMMALDKLISQRTADRPKVYARAKEINPNFNPANAELKLNLWKGFADPQGKEYQQVKSANTLLDHIGGALEASNSFHDNTKYGTAINEPMNKFRKDYEGDPNLAALMTSIAPVKSEFRTYLNNQHALTEHDKNAGDDMLNWNMSPAVLEQNLKTFAATAANRMVETNNGWKNVFGRDYPDLVSPSALETLRKLGPGSEASKTLAAMQSGGSILGSSDGRGTPGKTVGSLLNTQQQGSGNVPAITIPGQRSGETVVRNANGQPLGFTMPGKTGMRPIQPQQGGQ